MAEQAILFDTSLCTGCKGCQVACKCWNNLPSPIELNACAANFTGTYQNPPDINGDTRLIMTFDERDTDDQKGVAWAFGRRSCQHCTEAPCASVCPTHAIHKDEDTGMVTVTEDKCIGCKYCSMACPYDVPRYHGSEHRPIINKCTGCVDRIAQGMEPACVTTCQPNALKFGPRDEMIALAHERVELLKSRGYDQACVYGENEMGGLHVIQVFKYGVEAHGQVESPKKNPLVDVLSIAKPATGVAAAAVVVGLGVMYGLANGYKREERAYNLETKDTVSMETGEVIKHGDGQDPESVKEHLSEAIKVMTGKGDSNE